MTLKRIHAATLTLDDGRSFTVERIGKGRYSTAWKHGTDVYVQTHEDDHAKELLCHLSGKPHLPIVARVSTGGIYNWYKMPLYGKLTAANKQAWADYRYLQSMLEDAMRAEHQAIGYKGKLEAYIVNDRFVDLVEGSADYAVRYGDTVRSLAEWCSTYGSSWLIERLQARNCAVDDAGELILLDPVFDLALVEAADEKRAKKARGY